jgi:DNA-directed RNA polymerase subunit RPC12/RpoP
MPLLSCPKCGHEVADDADECQNCGSKSIKKMREWKAFKRRLVICSIIIIILLLLLYFTWPAGGLFPRNEFPKGPGSSQNRR